MGWRLHRRLTRLTSSLATTTAEPLVGFLSFLSLALTFFRFQPATGNREEVWRRTSGRPKKTGGFSTMVLAVLFAFITVYD